MKKVTKSLCRAALSIAAAITLFSGARSVAQAATDTVVIDFSQGQVYTKTVEELERESAQAEDSSKLSDVYKKLWFINGYMEKNEGTFYTPRYGYNYDKMYLELNKTPLMALSYSKSKDKDDNLQSLSADAGSSTGTYVVTYVQGQKLENCNCILRLAEDVYGINARNADGKRYVKVIFTFKNPKSAYVYVDGNGNVSKLIPDSEFTEGGYSYKVTKQGEEVAFTGVANAALKAVDIPATVVHQNITYRVTSVADKALFNNKKVRSVTIGQNVTTIGTSAFAKCKKLKQVTINSASVSSIGKKAFNKNSKNLVIKVPKEKYKAYKKMLKKAISTTAKLKKIK